MSRLLKEDADKLSQAYQQILSEAVPPWEFDTGAGDVDTPAGRKTGALSFGGTVKGWVLGSHENPSKQMHMFIKDSTGYITATNKFRGPGGQQNLENLAAQVYVKVVNAIKDSPNRSLNLIGSEAQQFALKNKSYFSGTEKEYGKDDRHALSAWILLNVFKPLNLMSAFGSQAPHIARDFVNALIELNIIKFSSTGETDVRGRGGSGGSRGGGGGSVSVAAPDFGEEEEEGGEGESTEKF